MTTPTHRKRWSRAACARNALCVAFATGVVALGQGCDRSASSGTGGAGSTQPAASAAMAVRYVEAWRSPIEVRLRAVGTTRSVDSVTVTAEVGGRVSSLGFADEAIVDRGQVLAEIDSALARAELDAVAARKERLRIVHDRTVEAFRAGASNQTEVDNARTLLAEVEAERERAARVVRDHTIVAPFEGRVGRRLVSVGALVSPGTPIAELRSVDPIQLVFSAPELYLASMRVGQRVEARSPAFPGRVFTGELAVSGSQVDQTTRTVEVYALVENPDDALKPGMFLSVEQVVDEKADAVLVPESAIVREGARADVFVIEDGKAVRRQVELGERRPGVVEVVSGVRAGDRVITQGIQRLRDGLPVAGTPDEDLESLGVRVGRRMDEQPSFAEVLAERRRGSPTGSGSAAARRRAAEATAPGELVGVEPEGASALPDDRRR